jgi:two-component system phosphate regulon sensor histidine kinase PhoR
MAAANSGYGEGDAVVTRVTSRLVEGRWLIAAAAVVMAVLYLAHALAGHVAALAWLAFAVAVALVPRARAIGEARTPEPAMPMTQFGDQVRVFADALPNPCFILDRRGTVRYANELAVAAFSIRPGEALTFRLRVPDLVAAFDSVARGGPPARVEFSERVPTERYFGAWFARLGEGDLIVLIIEDMSERRNADRVRVDFVANASHELRTPLASLAGFVETLQGPARDDAKARERFLAIMREQADRMSRLVNDLLSLSRIEMKAHVRPSGTVDLVAVVNHVADSLEPLARDLGVAIETEAPDGAVKIVGDRDELTQVFENLIENACKYGQGGKRVVVTVTPATAATGAQVSVRDFGPGIPEEHIPRLTERFYRVDVEDSRRHRGTGLGLAIVKHILARHLARLSIASRLGEGATFTVTFPAGAPGRLVNASRNSEPDQTVRLS